MRRIVIILCLLVGCVAVSAYSVHYADEANDVVSAAVTRSLGAMESGDKAALAHEIGALTDYWNREEDTLVHFVRHTQIDEIVRSVARLEALANREDYATLAAELSSIAWQMEHVWRNEQVLWGNLL
jgi:hypothetical protein